MIALPYDYFLIVWFVLAAASTAYVAVDQFRSNPEPTVMKWGFILVTLYMGPFGLLLYVLTDKEPHPGGHEQFTSPPWKQGVGSTIHCVAGGTPSSEGDRPDRGIYRRLLVRSVHFPVAFHEKDDGWHEVKDQSAKMIATGKATVDPANKKQLVVPFNEPLSPGEYKVEWHAVSDDTHRVKGNYSFSVAP
jgi:hypothetical protein